MKKLLICLLIMFYCFTVVGCGSAKVIGGVKYETYGLFNENTYRCDEIEYKPIWGNIIWGVILWETAIFPVYFYGFSMYEPVISKKHSNTYKK